MVVSSFDFADATELRRQLQQFQYLILTDWVDVLNQWNDLKSTWQDQQYDKFEPVFEELVLQFIRLEQDCDLHLAFLNRQLEIAAHLSQLPSYSSNASSCFGASSHPISLNRSGSLDLKDVVLLIDAANESISKTLRFSNQLLNKAIAEGRELKATLLLVIALSSVAIADTGQKIIDLIVNTGVPGANSPVLFIKELLEQSEEYHSIEGELVGQYEDSKREKFEKRKRKSEF